MFNRYELKYVADRRLVEAFRELLGALDRDPHGVDGFYPVWSRYYDTRDLRFYWEKIDGLRFRRKLRIRHYGAPDDADGRRRRSGSRSSSGSTGSPRSGGCACPTPRRCGSATGERAARRASRGDAGGRRGGPGAGRASSICGRSRSSATCARRFVGRERRAGCGSRSTAASAAATATSTSRSRPRTGSSCSPDLSVSEVKVNERVPYWLTELDRPQQPAARADVEVLPERRGVRPRAALAVPFPRR